MTEQTAEFDQLRAGVQEIANDLRDAREGLEPGSMARVGLDIAESRLRNLLATFPPATTTHGWPDADRCHHCGLPPEQDGDHTCPCPHPDADCPFHVPFPPAGSEG